MSDTEWLEWRRTGIGGSDVAALLGLSSHASPWSVWADKLGLTPPQQDTPRLRIGRRMESVLAEEFHDATGLFVAGEQTWCTHLEHEFVKCTVDGFAVESHRSALCDAVAVVEFKTDGRRGWDEIPPNYLAQVQWQMGVTQTPKAFVAVMFAGFRFEVFEVDYDPHDFEYMLRVASKFWHEHVLTGEPPAIDASDATARAIAAAWPKAIEGKTVDLTHLAHMFATRLELLERKKLIDNALDGIKNELAFSIADAETVELNGEPAYTYCPQPRRTIPAEALQAADSDLYARLLNETWFRVLRPVPKQRSKK